MKDKLKEITEGNKLIAEFMGGKVVSNIFICNESTRTHNEKCLDHYNIAQASYDSSWDWLMPVVEKIQHLENELPARIDFQIHLLGAVELHINNKRVFEMTAFEPGTLINAVYKGVIEFIKWYNQNKQS